MAKEKAAVGVGSTEGGKAEKAAAMTGSTSDSYNNQFTTSRGLISSILSHGRENSLTGRELKGLLSLKSGRDVTALVEMERCGGIPICASCNSKRPGYFLPTDPAELAGYIKSLRRRIRNITQTADSLQKALDDWSGQQCLDLPGDGKAGDR